VGIYTKIPLESRDDLSLAYTPGVAAVSMAIAKDTEESFAITNRANTVAMLVGRIGTKWTVTLGLLILAAAVVSLSMLDVTTAYWVAGVSLFFFGIGGANTIAPTRRRHDRAT
jgi:malic enzyme